MSKKQSENAYTRNQTLCWDCAKACAGCNWSRQHEPVDGWEAVPTKIKICSTVEMDTYRVINCPEFERDALNGGTIRLPKVKGEIQCEKPSATA